VRKCFHNTKNAYQEMEIIRNANRIPNTASRDELLRAQLRSQGSGKESPLRLTIKCCPADLYIKKPQITSTNFDAMAIGGIGMDRI
jgi:hypothetical protein